MAGRALLLVVVLVAAACGGSTGSAGTPAPTIGAPGGSLDPGTSAVGGTGGPGQDLTPSGARWRIANFYRDAAGRPTDIDVYGDFNAQAGPLLKTVRYGTLSEFFDPGRLDDQGDANLSFYPAGRTGTDDQIGSQTATLKGDEVVTMAIATGENTSQNGTALGRWKTFYENGQDFPLPTAPTSGDAVLMADGVALAAFPNTTETFAFLGVDGTCLPSVEGGPDGGGQPLAPHSQQSYIYPAGSHNVTVHLANADCGAKSPYPAIPVALSAGERAWLFFYSPDDGQLQTLLVPVGS